MSYTRLHWVESETPLSAQNMNNIEDGIEELQAQKVDKVSGKALSDNNYTDAEKTKLAGIAVGAEVNVQSDWNQTSSSADDFIKNKPGNATTSVAGFMSSSDKSKLDGIAAGAEVNLNNFTKVSVESGSATVLRPTTKDDTFSIIAGSNVTMTASGKQVTINAKDTTYSDVTTSAHGLMTAADKTKLNGIAAGAQVNPGVATTSANGLMSSSDKSKLNGIAAGAQVNPGAATTSAAGLMSAADKTKLNGIATGAEVNQNAFSNVKVGSTTVAADGKTDTLELVAGSNVTLTPDATNDKVTIAATNTTYSVATTSANGLMSSTDKAKLDGCKKITISTSNPSGGSNGDVWFVYS